MFKKQKIRSPGCQECGFYPLPTEAQSQGCPLPHSQHLASNTISRLLLGVMGWVSQVQDTDGGQMLGPGTVVWTVQHYCIRCGLATLRSASWQLSARANLTPRACLLGCWLCLEDTSGAQWLGTLNALPGDPCSIPGSLTATYNFKI